MNRRFALQPLAEAGQALRGQWRAQAVSAPVFLSWEWLDAQRVTSGLAQDMHVLVHDGAPLAMLSRRRVLRHGFMPVRQWHLNETGDRAADRVALEYNGFLQQGLAQDAFGWLLRYLPAADELVVRNAAEPTIQALEAAALTAGWRARNIKETAAPWRDLAGLRASSEPFEARLGRNTRAAIRRSRRLYEDAYGPLSLARAGDGTKAQAWFARLEELHTAQWAARGQGGAFADDRFRAFHRRFLAGAHGPATADILCIRAGAQEVGYLYNLRSPGGWVMAYQSGFAPVPDNRWKPGYLCHALAVTYYADAGASRYDFMAGPAPYKRQLADRVEPLRSMIAFAPRLHLVLDDRMRRGRCRLRHTVRKARKSV
jgi:CelD/BcsL family acetyltransferase involved in cellulose biosynthesis